MTLFALAASPFSASASPPAQGQYTLHIPGASSDGQTGGGGSGSGWSAIAILGVGLVALGGAGGFVAYRRRRERLDSTA